jgi:hypothetical protein
MSSHEMSADEYERLYEDARVALQAAVDANDAIGVLRLVDEWIARWRDVEPIPDAGNLLYIAALGTLHTNSGVEALAYADAVAELAERAQDPNANNVVGRVVESYANVTETTERVDHTRAAAEAARRFTQRVARPHEKINAQLARALRNLAVDEDSLDACLALAEEIRQLSARHAGSNFDIDEHLAAALGSLARPLGHGTTEHMELVDELAVLHQRWSLSVEIAGVYVAETWNAYAKGGLEAEPEQLLARIESIRSALPESDDRIEKALTYLRAKLDRRA